MNKMKEFILTTELRNVLHILLDVVNAPSNINRINEILEAGTYTKIDKKNLNYLVRTYEQRVLKKYQHINETNYPA